MNDISPEAEPADWEGRIFAFCAAGGALIGLFFGFMSAGIGGAIVGAIVGGLLGLLVPGLIRVGVIAAFWVAAIALGIGFIMLISNLWGVGRP